MLQVNEIRCWVKQTSNVTRPPSGVESSNWLRHIRGRSCKCGKLLATSRAFKAYLHMHEAFPSESCTGVALEMTSSRCDLPFEVVAKLRADVMQPTSAVTSQVLEILLNDAFPCMAVALELIGRLSHGAGRFSCCSLKGCTCFTAHQVSDGCGKIPKERKLAAAGKHRHTSEEAHEPSCLRLDDSLPTLPGSAVWSARLVRRSRNPSLGLAKGTTKRQALQRGKTAYSRQAKGCRGLKFKTC